MIETVVYWAYIFKIFYALFHPMNKSSYQDLKEAFVVKYSELNKKHLVIMFAFFVFLYFTLDKLNMSYPEMRSRFGLWLVVLNMVLNLVMSSMSAFMIILSEHVLEEKHIKTKGDTMSFISILFGILTYGCTPCVISFFAVFGISFSVVALPLAGLPYKLVSLFLLGLGIGILFKELERKSCKINF